MSHFIDTMAYSGEIPWHRLGTKLANDASTEDMIRAAQLAWNVVKTPLFYLNEHNMLTELPDAFGMLRDDTDKAFDGVTVGATYAPFQNSELFAFGDALRES